MFDGARCRGSRCSVQVPEVPGCEVRVHGGNLPNAHNDAVIVM